MYCINMVWSWNGLLDVIKQLLFLGAENINNTHELIHLKVMNKLSDLLFKVLYLQTMVYFL